MDESLVGPGHGTPRRSQNKGNSSSKEDDSKTNEDIDMNIDNK